MKKNRRIQSFALLILAVVLLAVIAVLGSFWQEAAIRTDFTRKNLAPCIQYPFGTDWMGRDMFVRTVAGLSLSIRIGLLTAAVSAVMAFVLGLSAAVFGKFVDSVVRLLIDIVMGIPHMLLLILISFACGRGFWGVVCGIAFTHWASLARLIRGEVLQLKQSQYVKIAEKLGKGKFYIAFSHMAPNLVPQFITGLVLMFPHAILHEASITSRDFSSLGPCFCFIIADRNSADFWIRAVFMSKEAGKMNDTILEVKDLSVTFTQYERGFSRRTIHAVEKMDLEIKSGEIVAVVGSSGSGKSLLAHAIMGILPYNSEMDGEIRFLGEPLTEKKVKRLRGHEIVLVPQSVSYLDPLMKIGDQIQNGKKDVSVKKKCLAVLKRYGLAPDIRGKYPFQLSGGMTRRVLISTAVMEKPMLVIADEPTPGLHLEAATRVMGHFREMADDGAGVLLITHDLELALLTADRVIVLYGGRVVEETDAAAFQDERNLKHPYTKALFRSMPKNWKKDGEQLCDMGEILEDTRKEYGR